MAVSASRTEMPWFHNALAAATMATSGPKTIAAVSTCSAHGFGALAGGGELREGATARWGLTTAMREGSRLGEEGTWSRRVTRAYSQDTRTPMPDPQASA